MGGPGSSAITFQDQKQPRQGTKKKEKRRRTTLAKKSSMALTNELESRLAREATPSPGLVSIDDDLQNAGDSDGNFRF